MNLLRIFLLVGCINVVMSYDTAWASRTQVGRYKTVSNKPTAAQVNPLLAIGQYKFASSIRTVGQAIGQVLSTSGYRLVDEKTMNKNAKSVLKLPLPLVDRELGPMAVQDIVSVLMGRDIFNLRINPLQRTINFSVKPSVAKQVGVTV